MWDWDSVDVGVALSGRPLEVAERLEDTLAAVVARSAAAPVAAFPDAAAPVHVTNATDDLAPIKAKLRAERAAKQAVLKAAKDATKAANRKDPNIDLRDAMFDVQKFAIAAGGYAGSEAEAAKVRLAVGLGAKAPKPKAQNYVALKAERRQLKESGGLPKPNLSKISKKSKRKDARQAKKKKTKK